MKDIIIKYLDKNYKFTLSTYVSYNLYDRNGCKEVRLKEVLENIMHIFNISNEELRLIFDDWADTRAIEMQNKVTDFRYKLYELTGIDLQLTAADLNKMLIDDDNAVMFDPNAWFTNHDKPV